MVCNTSMHTVAISTHSEGVERKVGLLVDAPDPPLVANLDLEDPKLASGDGGLDQVVLATLIAIGSPGQDVQGVVLLALFVLGGTDSQDGGSRDPVGGEAALGLGLACDGGSTLTSDQIGHGNKERKEDVIEASKQAAISTHRCTPACPGGIQQSPGTSPGSRSQ